MKTPIIDQDEAEQQAAEAAALTAAEWPVLHKVLSEGRFDMAALMCEAAAVVKRTQELQGIHGLDVLPNSAVLAAMEAILMRSQTGPFVAYAPFEGVFGTDTNASYVNRGAGRSFGEALHGQGLRNALGAGAPGVLSEAVREAWLERQFAELGELAEGEAKLLELEEAAERQRQTAASARSRGRVLDMLKADVPSVVVVAMVVAALAALVGYGSFVGSAAHPSLSPAILHVTAFIPIAVILLLGLAGSWLFWLDSKPKR